MNGGRLTGHFVGEYLNAVTYFSVLAGDASGDQDSVTLNVYDAAGSLIDSDSFTGIAAQTLSVSGSGIASFELLQTNLVPFDNFTFTADAVPEPAMLGLFGLGALGLGLSRRRKR